MSQVMSLTHPGQQSNIVIYIPLYRYDIIVALLIPRDDRDDRDRSGS